MSLPVHLVPSLEGVVAGAEVEVTGDEAHHAVAVRRLRVGEEVVLTDGRGSRAVGTVGDTGKRRFTVRITQAEQLTRPSPRFTVVQALPKGDRGELAVEVMTEVGVDRVVPWAAARCVAVWRGERAVRSHAKWQATAREAAKQARRSWHPEVAPLASTDEVVDLVRSAPLALVLHEEGSTSLADIPALDSEVLLVVGPEGGLTEAEVATLTDAGAHVVRLGSEVLRTSTAGVAALSALMSRTPRWR